VKDAIEYFGYAANAAYGRVPGPFVPLQDEPQDVDDVSSRKNIKTVLVPQIQSMKDYILKHHKRMIFHVLNQNIQTGQLDIPLTTNGTQPILTNANCAFGEISFWRYDKYTAIADIIINPLYATNDGLSNCPLYVEMWINMKTGMEFYTGECGMLRDIPERHSWRLSNYLIPILRKDEIESGAEQLLLDYCPNALSNQNEHCPYTLARRMGLSVERLPLYKKSHTLSMLFFCEGTVMVQDPPEKTDEDPPEPYEVTIPGNTILINTCAVHKDYCQLEIYHECVHFDWHFMFYRLQHMHNNDINALRTKRVVVTDNSKTNNPLSWMEWQASRGSFGLMMPMSMMNQLLNSERKKLSGSDYHWGKRYEIIARTIAAEYELPKFRVRARLIQMGCIAAKGSLNYVDERYIEPFAFSTSKGGENYTFVLTRKNLLDEYEANPEFRDRIHNGQFVYADGHLCVNDERFIRETPQGLRLTPWANAHVDQCCLRFINVYEPAGISDYRFGCLNSDEEYNRHYISFAETGCILSQKEKLKHMSKILNALPANFPDTLAVLMEQAHITEELLEERSGISARTISRLRSEERSNYSMDQVIVLCIALQLPPWLSCELLERAGLILRRTKQHRAYRLILDCMFMDDVETVQRFLRDSDCEPLKHKAS